MPLGIPHSGFLGWSEEDQDLALAYTREMRKVCTSCGTKAEDWQDDRFALVAHPQRCIGCEAIEQERGNVPAGEHGVYITLIPRRLAEELEGEPGVIP